ncbi:tape measure protein [Paenibacillus macerans]|uniref:tape measure protein n=1 Tax=Paenibacillus macerans TaxID=44252 RepID=UPI00203E4178|nr:tape measure protein [Paenibacillus macerans]MCM3701425.1 tape measure protein [Paenibacillus macerans]
MPTISTALRMADQFSSPLARVITQAEKAAMAMDRLRRTVETPATLRINANNAEQQLRGIERVVKSVKLDVTFNARQAVQRAQMLKRLLQRQLDGIQARIRVELPASLNVMFANLQKLVMKFIAATSRLRGVAGDQRAAQEKIAELQEKILQLQNQINAATRQSGNASSGWLSNLTGIVGTYLSLQGIKSGMSISDEYINSLARLDMVNDGLRTTAELQDDIFAAANRARGSYTDMAGVIGRMGILAEDAFKGNDELVAFSELMQKSFRVGGASTMEQQAGMYQLSQAMAAGKLQGDEFRSIMENAPLLAKAIADFTGKSKGDLKEMSADGTITADIIKGAMFNAADDINQKFNSMPMTFGDAMNLIKNNALQTFGPVIERINKMLNSAGGEQMMANIQNGIEAAAVAVDRLLTAAVNVYSFFSNNWSTIEPIITGIVGAFVAWKVATMAINTVLAIQSGIQALLAARTALATGATFAQTVAQWGLNTAMLANPITWIIIAIVALIAAIVLLVKYLINLWNTNDKFAAGLMRAWNSVLNFFGQIPIFFQEIGNGIANAFDWAKVESLKIMETLANGVIDNVNWVIEQLNKIPGVSLDVFDHLSVSGAAAAEAEAKKQARKANLETMKEEAAQKAAEREKKVQDMLDERAAKRAREETEKENKEKSKDKGTPDFDKFKTTPPNIDKVGKVGEVGKIKDKVDISSEDLKMMRELANIKTIQNFVTLTPTSIVNTGDIRNGEDFDTIVAKIDQTLQESITAHAANVYT